MKNIFIVLTAAITISLSASCQGLKVPEAVKNAFAARFPAATNVSWGKENAKEYEAEFKLNNNSVSANFGLDGSWVETESVIPVSELPAAVKTAVSTKYPGGSITLAEKTEQPGNKVLFEVAVKVNGKKKSMELNPDGTAAH
ncbi:MAG TPA: PepSY-like domain-containing protein [Chitinophagaceae bacterium]